jgi:two-component system chemotaxis response regulator CheB
VRSRSQIRVLIADDHDVFAEALTLLLDADPRLEVVGSARNGREVVELAQQLEPDVVLIDLDMPVVDGVTATGKLIKVSPARVAILTASTHHVDEQRARDAGASAYLTKGCSAAEVIAAIVSLGPPDSPGRHPDPLHFRAALPH